MENDGRAKRLEGTHHSREIVMDDPSPSEERDVLALLEEDAHTSIIENDGEDQSEDTNNAIGNDDDEEDTAQFLLSMGAQPLLSLIPKSPSPPPPESDDDAMLDMSSEAKGSNIEISQLYSLCNRLYGNCDSLQWSFGPEGGAAADKKATLIITLPNGNKRLFKSRGHWRKKAQAKASAALVAIESGAIDFLATGSDEKARIQGPVSENVEADGKTSEDKSCEERIIDQCQTWRKGKVQPVYTYTIDSKQGIGFGCALSIYLSKVIQRSWSIRIAYPTKQEAKVAVCQEAIRSGIMDFIAHGDGLKEPWDDNAAANHPKKIKELILLGATKDDPTHISQQAYYDALNKENVPSDVGFGNHPINPINYFYQLVNRVRRFGVLEQFTNISEPNVHQAHGCLLRLAHGEDSFSYLVPSAFAKRSEAKAAVCLLAISQGVKAILEDIHKNRSTDGAPRVGKDHNKGIAKSRDIITLSPGEQGLGELCLEAISAELRLFRLDATPKFDAQKNPDGSFTTRVEVFTNPKERRLYASTGKFKTKHDAKLAACVLAVERGILEFIRFRGAPVPNGYVRPPVGGVDIPYVPDPAQMTDIRQPFAAGHRVAGRGSQAFSSRESLPPTYPHGVDRPDDRYAYSVPPVSDYGNGDYAPPGPDPFFHTRHESRGAYEYPDQADLYPVVYDHPGEFSGPHYPPPPSAPARYPPERDYCRNDLSEMGGGYDPHGPAGNASYQRDYQNQPTVDFYDRYPTAPWPSGSHFDYPTEGRYDSDYRPAEAHSYPGYPPYAPPPSDDRRSHYDDSHEYTSHHDELPYHPYPREHLYSGGGPEHSEDRAVTDTPSAPRERRVDTSDQWRPSLHWDDRRLAVNGKLPTISPTTLGLSSAAVVALLAPKNSPVVTASSSKPSPSVAIPVPPSGTSPSASKSADIDRNADTSKGMLLKNPQKRTRDDNSQKTPVSLIKTKSFFNELLDFCRDNNFGLPEFHSEPIMIDSNTRYKVWVTLERERMELKTTYASVAEGRERLSKIVEERLKNKLANEGPPSKRIKMESR